MSILDVPVGTGRFFQNYLARGHKVVGVDTSPDMLAQARRFEQDSDRRITLVQGEAENLPIPTGAVDCVVCFRFLNWVPLPVFDIVMGELCRVTRDRIIARIRLSDRPRFFTLLRRLVKPRTVVRLLGWPLNRARGALRARRASGGLVIHRADDVDKVFRQYGLAIEAVVSVDEGQSGVSGILNPIKVFVLRKEARPQARWCAQ